MSALACSDAPARRAPAVASALALTQAPAVLLLLLLVLGGCSGARQAAAPAVAPGPPPSPASAPASETDADDGIAVMLASGIPPEASAEQIYATICQGCHMADGRGAQGAGRYPPLAGNPALASSAYVAVTILHGRRNMPAFARPRDRDFFFAPVWLTDQQVADVVNYLRTGFGNTWTDPISADQVRALHP
jgi:mono/diheme cytochrome c family protein